MCCVGVFGTLVPCALFLLCFCSYVSALRTILNEFCLIAWNFRASCTVLHVFCTICGDVRSFCSVFNVLCLSVWYVTFFRTVLTMFFMICIFISALRSFECIL